MALHRKVIVHCYAKIVDSGGWCYVCARDVNWRIVNVLQASGCSTPNPNPLLVIDMIRFGSLRLSMLMLFISNKLMSEVDFLELLHKL